MVDARKTAHITNGQWDSWISEAEYESLIARLPKGERANIRRLNDIPDVIVQDTAGLHRGKLTDEEYRAQAEAGRAKIVTSPEDVQSWQNQEQDWANKELAGGWTGKSLVALDHLSLGGAAAMQNAVFGAEEGARVRSETEAANPMLGTGIDLALLAAGGVGARNMLGRTVLGTPLGRAGALAAEGALATTYLHAEHLLRYNKPFVAEDYAKDMIIGAVFTAPFIAGAAARGLVGSGLRGLANHGLGTGALRAGRDAMALAGITAPLGSMKSKVMMRGAAALGLADRLRGRAQTSVRSAIRGVDAEKAAAARAAAKTAAQEAAALERMTPEGFRKMTVTQRAAAVATLKEYGFDVGVVDFDGMAAGFKAVSKSTTNMRKQVQTMNMKVGNPTEISEALSPGQMGNFMVESEVINARLNALGYGDIVNYLEPLSATKSPGQAYGAYVQARIDAALKKGTTPGAAEADKLLGKFITHEETWGGARVAIGKDVNDAVTNLVDAYRILDKDIRIPHTLEQVTSADSAQLKRVSEQATRLREAYATLERRGFLSRSQVKPIEAVITEAEEAVKRGYKSYMDAGKINNAREGAKATRAESAKAKETVPQNPEDVQATKTERTVETAKYTNAIKQYMGEVLGGRSTVTETLANLQAEFGVRGVYALREMDKREKETLYLHLQETLPPLVSSPELLEEYLGEQIAGIDSTDPEHAFLSSSAAAQTVFYLAGTLPRVDGGLYTKDLPPPRAKMEAYLEKVAACMDPPSVQMAAIEGRVTRNMLDALRNTSPAFLVEMQVGIDQLIQDADPLKIPRKTLNGLAQLQGFLDPTRRGKILMELQSDYAQNSQQQNQIFGPNGAQPLQGNFKIQNNPQQSGSPFTFTQRLMN